MPGPGKTLTLLRMSLSRDASLLMAYSTAKENANKGEPGDPCNGGSVAAPVLYMALELQDLEVGVQRSC